MTTALEFQVRREDFAQTRWTEAQTRADQPLEQGEALLRVDRFGLTTNNITYALVGDSMGYWNFFPAPEGWGRVPVWGFADVVASRAPGVREGDRVFGYLPISTFLRVRPDSVSEQSFVDASEHRRALPAVYQQYTRTRPADSAKEGTRAVLAPVVGTGFLIDDFLLYHQLFGARQVLFAAASSKTALATAYSMSRRTGRGFETVALTSARNAAFCQRVGYYDRVVEYENVASLSAATPSVLVDMAADANVTRAVHSHFGEALRYDCLVGMTHQPASLAPPPDLVGPAPQLFFAPHQVERRRKDWGAAEFGQRLGAAQQGFFDASRAWLELEHRQGRDEVEAAYRSVLAGEAPPHVGFVLSL